MAVVTDYTALISDYDWLDGLKERSNGDPKGATFVTYCFLETSEVPSTLSYQPYYNTGYSGMTTAQRNGFRDAIAELERVCGVRLVEVNNPADAQIEIMNTDGSDWAGWSDYANPYNGVRLVIDGEGTYASGTTWFEVILHELGHAMGLKHPFDGPTTLSTRYDNEDYTLMSYTSNRVNDRSYAAFDVTALQSIYGRGAGATQGWRYGWDTGLKQFWLIAGVQNDVATAPALSARMSGGDGNDRLVGHLGAVTLYGGNGTDVLFGSSGPYFPDNKIDKLFGDAGNDRISLLSRSAEVFGGGGDDVIGTGESYFGSCTVQGGTGNDRIEMAQGSMTVSGGEGDDLIIFHQNNFYTSRIDGGIGLDQLRIQGRADVSLGTATAVNGLRVANVETVILTRGGSATGDRLANTLTGSIYTDTLAGGGGDDRMSGGGGRDWLDGGVGHDRVFGDGGADRITSRDGGDFLYGGAGADVFVLAEAAGLTHWIMDFEDGIDRIDLPRFAGSLDPYVIRQSGANTLLYRPGDATHAELRVILTGVTVTELTAGDFF